MFEKEETVADLKNGSGSVVPKTTLPKPDTLTFH
jgi:hypothetical protein